MTGTRVNRNGGKGTRSTETGEGIEELDFGAKTWAYQAVTCASGSRVAIRCFSGGKIDTFSTDFSDKMCFTVANYFI